MSVVVIGLSHRSAPVELRERFAFAGTRFPAPSGNCATPAWPPRPPFSPPATAWKFTPPPRSRRTPRLPDQKNFSSRTKLTTARTPPPPPKPTLPAATKSTSRPTRTVASSLQGRQRYGLDGPRRDGNFRPTQEGLRTGLHAQAYRRAAEQGLPARLQRGQTHPHRDQHPARQCVRNVHRRGTGRKDFHHPRRDEVLVIGAGETSKKTARALQSRSIKNITVTNRSPNRAAALAAELAGRTVPFERWPDAFERVDIAISSTAAPQPILDRAQLEPLMQRRQHRPLLLINIAVPRDIDPAVAALDNVYLYNVDDLQGIANEYLGLRRRKWPATNRVSPKKSPPCWPPAGHQPQMGTDETQMGRTRGESSDAAQSVGRAAPATTCPTGPKTHPNGLNHRANGLDHDANGLNIEIYEHLVGSFGLEMDTNGLDHRTNAPEMRANGLDQDANGLDLELYEHLVGRFGVGGLIKCVGSDMKSIAVTAKTVGRGRSERLPKSGGRVWPVRRKSSVGLECGSPLPLWHRQACGEKGRGLPHSKTLARRPAIPIRPSRQPYF